MRANHSHWEGGPPCDLSTKRACDDRAADWAAMQQVILAYNIVVQGRAKAYSKEPGLFGQLVQYIAGMKASLDNKDGTPSESAFTKRVVAALARVSAGDLPVYNLYEPGVPAQQ